MYVKLTNGYQRRTKMMKKKIEDDDDDDDSDQMKSRSKKKQNQEFKTTHTSVAVPLSVVEPAALVFRLS